MSSRANASGGTQAADARGKPRPSRRRAAPAPAAGLRRWWRFGIALVGAALLVNALAGERGYLDYRRLEARHAEAEAELAAIRAQNEALRRRNRQLKSDPVAIEEEVRGQLGYVRAGEVLFTIRDAPAPTGTPVAPR